MGTHRIDHQQRSGGWEDLVESAALGYVNTGWLDPRVLDEIQLIPGIAAIFDRVRSRQWERARARGWDEELVRRVLRKLPPTLARGLLDGERLSTIDELTLLGWLMRLPQLPSVTRPAAGNNKMADRVRALLAKAESSTFPEEAEAFTMKAQQLITEHCLQDALSSGTTGGGPGLVRIVADDPYADAKSLLIAVVAGANRCKAVWFAAWGFATVVGYQADLEAAELIYTSLLVQATRSMTAVGQDHAGRRSRGFRRAFLIAFASRIGERMTAAQESAQEPIADDRLLPVLAARDARVEVMTRELFPELSTKAVSVSNGHGWAAGRSAADHAELTPLERVTGG